MSDAVSRIADAMRKRAAQEVSGMVREQLSGLRLNPSDGPFVDDEEGDEDEDEEDEDEDEEDDGEDDGGDDGEDDGEDEEDAEESVGALAWEDADGEKNLQAAAAAYRVLGGKGDLVAQHPGSGRAFFGNEEELDEYALGLDLADDEWDVYDTSDSILALKYDEGSMREVMGLLRQQEIDAARKQFEEFHWGDESSTTVVKEIDGVDGALSFLGIARRIEYYAVKDGEPAEYFHEFGEESGVYPSIYALGEKTIVIHGGNTTVTPRGIVD